MECLLFIDTPEESCIGVVSSMQEEQCSSLEGHCCSSNQLVHAYCVLGVGALLANNHHRQSDSNHYFITFICSNSRTILNSVMIMIKTEVLCWLGHSNLFHGVCLYQEPVAFCKKNVILPFLCF